MPDFFDNPVDYALENINAVFDYVGDTVEEWSMEWENTYQQFLNEIKQFNRLYGDLARKQTELINDPVLYTQVGELLTKGNMLKTTIDALGLDTDMGVAQAAIVPLALLVALSAGIAAWIVLAQDLLVEVNKTIGTTADSIVKVAPYVIVAGLIGLYLKNKGKF